MSRADYTDDWDCDPESNWRMIRYRGAVKSAFRGKRGQAFFRELIAALDAMPVKELISDHLQSQDGYVCAIGAVGAARGVDMSSIDAHDSLQVSGALGIADCMAREIVYENDDCGGNRETPAQRWARMRLWAQRQLEAPKPGRAA